MSKYRIKKVTHNDNCTLYIPQKLHFGIFWGGCSESYYGGSFNTEQAAKDHIDGVIGCEVKTTTYKDYHND